MSGAVVAVTVVVEGQGRSSSSSSRAGRLRGGSNGSRRICHEFRRTCLSVRFCSALLSLLLDQPSLVVYQRRRDFNKAPNTVVTNLTLYGCDANGSLVSFNGSSTRTISDGGNQTSALEALIQP